MQNTGVTLDETGFDEWYKRGLAELRSGKYGAGRRSFRRALALVNDSPAAHYGLGRALFGLGEVDSAIDHFLRAAEAPDAELRAKALRSIACVVPGSARADHSAVLEARRAWAKVEAELQGPAIPTIRPPNAPYGKLRVGYCSKFLDARNWMKPVWGALHHHDRSAFEIHLFSDGDLPGAKSGYQANPLDHVHNTRGMSNADLASLIARSRIDVLVDLNGYSHQERLGLFLRRPAPVNIGWFNMYATSGIDAFDYIVGDAVVIPSSEERFYSERVLRIPGTYLAYTVLYPVPDVAPAPVLASGHITFGSLCSQYKITDDVVAAWAMVLRQAPAARLLIKNAALGDSTNRAALRRRFRVRGIARDRVVLEGPAPHETFLAAYGKVDIALDTFPYNGGTTTMEALWQGVPVLSFNGDRWASRQSRSLLLAAGLDQWCAPDLDGYIARAVELARSPATAARLISLRATMRELLARMPVCDSAGLSRALEDIYREVSTAAAHPERTNPRE